MGLIKKDETFPPRSVMVIIVGTPFSYKTSLTLTAKNPLLFDFEKGSERAHGRAETYRVDNSWKEVEDDLAAGLLDAYDSVIADTGGALVDDYLWEYGLKVKYTRNDMQNWGTVKTLFKTFFSTIRGKGKDLIVISHEKSKDKNDETVYDLDISGGGKQLLLRQADQIGFISKKDFKDKGVVTTKTILTFWPTASLPFCKNVAGLEDIVLPDCKSKDWEGFLDRVVIQPTRKAIVEMSEDQKNAIQFIEEWRTSIDAIEPIEGDNDKTHTVLLETLNDIAKIEPEHMKTQIRNYFSGHLTKIDWGWVKEPKPGKFMPKAASPVVVKQEETPTVEEKPIVADAPPADAIDLVAEAEQQRADLSTPQINKNPHTAPPKSDLFAPAGG